MAAFAGDRVHLGTDGFMVAVPLRLRAREPEAPFHVPLYPLLPLLFAGVYLLLFAGAAWQQPGVTAITLLALAVTYLASGAIVADSPTA